MVLDVLLRLTHPFMPFISSALWQHLHDNPSPLIKAVWYTAQSTQSKELINSQQHINFIIECITRLRALRSILTIQPALKLPLWIEHITDEYRSVLDEYRDALHLMGRITIINYQKPTHKGIVIEMKQARMTFTLPQDFKAQHEQQRLQKDKTDAQQRLSLIHISEPTRPY